MDIWSSDESHTQQNHTLEINPVIMNKLILKPMFLKSNDMCVSIILTCLLFYKPQTIKRDLSC